MPIPMLRSCRRQKRGSSNSREEEMKRLDSCAPSLRSSSLRVPHPSRAALVRSFAQSLVVCSILRLLWFSFHSTHSPPYCSPSPPPKIKTPTVSASPSRRPPAAAPRPPSTADHRGPCPCDARARGAADYRVAGSGAAGPGRRGSCSRGRCGLGRVYR